MNAILNYILRNMNDFDYSISKIVRRQSKMQRNVCSMSVMMMFYIISTGIILKIQDEEIKNLKKKIEEIQQMKGD